jgi:hypothetical protein
MLWLRQPKSRGRAPNAAAPRCPAKLPIGGSGAPRNRLDLAAAMREAACYCVYRFCLLPKVTLEAASLKPTLSGSVDFAYYTQLPVSKNVLVAAS